MDTKLIFFDIDGTILDEHTHTVPLSAINAIKKLNKMAINVSSILADHALQ